MDSLLAMVFILVTFAVADLIAVKTKSIISSMFTCSLIFIVGFWLGIPKTLFSDSMMIQIGGVLITMLLAHMGTMMSLHQLGQQWRTVLIACGAIVGIALLVLGVGQFIMGRNEALVAAPVISGGVIAAIKMQETMVATGVPNAESLAVFATVLMVMEGFIGYPVASFCLSKEAKRIKKEIADGTFVASDIETSESPKRKKLLPEIPEKYAGENFYLAKLALTGLAATFISQGLQSLAGFNIVDKNIMSLLLGIVLHEVGFLESGIMNRANSGGLAMTCLMTVVFASLANATPDVLLNILPDIIVSQLLGIAGYAIFTIIVGKLLGVSPWISIAIGSTANYGFPGTFVISREVAQANGDTPEERELILGEIMPKMLVAGFITVSIASVFLANIMAGMI